MELTMRISVVAVSAALLCAPPARAAAPARETVPDMFSVGRMTLLKGLAGRLRDRAKIGAAMLDLRDYQGVLTRSPDALDAPARERLSRLSPDEWLDALALALSRGAKSRKDAASRVVENLSGDLSCLKETPGPDCRPFQEASLRSRVAFGLKLHRIKFERPQDMAPVAAACDGPAGFEACKAAVDRALSP